MIIGVDPKVDYAFKWLFGDARRPHGVIHILNAILNPPPGEEIVEIEILNPFTEKTGADDKQSILDIRVRDQLGRQYNVEMQMTLPLGLRQRILYYWAKLYSSQLLEGDDYPLLRPTISVCFVDGVMFPKETNYHSQFRLLNSAGGAALTDDLAIHFFELPKFKLTAEELTTPLEAWLYFLRHAQRLDSEALPGTLNTVELRRAVEDLMMLTEIEVQREMYESRERARRDALTWTNGIARAEAKMEAAEAKMEAAEAKAVEAEAKAVEAEAKAQAAQAQAQAAEAKLEAAEAKAAEAQAQAAQAQAAEGLAKGILVGRIELLQRLARQDITPRAELEAMPLPSLAALAAQLEGQLPT